MINLQNRILNSNLCLVNTIEPTRIVPGQTGSLLGLAIIPDNTYNLVMYYIHPDCFNSDHNPVSLTLHSKFEKKKKRLYVEESSVRLERFTFSNESCY